MDNTIRGCHPSVTPTVLLETLPKYVSEAMVTRFQAHLSGQLHHLMSNTVPMPTAQHCRNNSESGYSATSSQESANEYPDAYQEWLSVHNLNKPNTT